MITADLELSSTGDILLNNGDINILYADDLIKQLAIIMLRSQIGEWKLFPDLGFGLQDFVKSPNTEELANEIQDRLYSYISLNPAFDSYTPIIDIYPTDKDELRIDFSLANQNGTKIDIGINMNLLHGVYLNVDEYDILSHTIYISEIKKRIEKRVVKNKTNILTFQFYPIPDYTVRVFKADEYNNIDNDNEYDDIIQVDQDILNNRIIDFKIKGNIYNDIIQQDHIITQLTIQDDWNIDIVKLEANNWIYYIEDETLWNIIKESDEINIKALWIDCYTVGVLTKINNRIVNDASISPENEDSRKYDVVFSKELIPDTYIIEYYSLKTS